MPLYIIRPKVASENRTAGAVAMVSRSLTREKRASQVTEVVAHQTSDPVRQDIKKWLADRKSVQPQLRPDGATERYRHSRCKSERR